MNIFSPRERILFRKREILSTTFRFYWQVLHEYSFRFCFDLAIVFQPDFWLIRHLLQAAVLLRLRLVFFFWRFRFDSSIHFFRQTFGVFDNLSKLQSNAFQVGFAEHAVLLAELCDHLAVDASLLEHLRMLSKAIVLQPRFDVTCRLRADSVPSFRPHSVLRWF